MSPGNEGDSREGGRPEAATAKQETRSAGYREAAAAGEPDLANYTAAELGALRQLYLAFPGSRVGEFEPNGQQALWNGDGP